MLPLKIFAVIRKVRVTHPHYLYVSPNFMFEILIFTIVLIVATAVAASLIYLSGTSFQLRFGDAWLIAVIALTVYIPGIANIIIFFNRNGQDDRVERIFALLRGFGMLMCGSSVLAFIFLSDVRVVTLIVGFVIGMVLWWGLMPFEYRYSMYSKGKRF